MVLREHFILGDNVYTIEKARRKGYQLPTHKYLRREEAQTGKYKYIYEEATRGAKAVLKEFKKVYDIDNKIKDLKSKINELKDKKVKIVDKIEPLFNELKAYKIGIKVKNVLLSLVKIEKQELPYARLYKEALSRLSAQAQRELEVLEDKLKHTVTYVRSEYEVAKSYILKANESSTIHDEKLEKLGKEIEESLKKLIDIRKEINDVYEKILAGKKIEKSYAATKKWNDQLESQWPTVDKDPTTYPDEDFEMRKKPIRHIRMRTGKPYYAGTGFKEELLPKTDMITEPKDEEKYMPKVETRAEEIPRIVNCAYEVWTKDEPAETFVARFPKEKDIFETKDGYIVADRISIMVHHGRTGDFPNSEIVTAVYPGLEGRKKMSMEEYSKMIRRIYRGR